MITYQSGWTTALYSTVTGTVSQRTIDRTSYSEAGSTAVRTVYDRWYYNSELFGRHSVRTNILHGVLRCEAYFNRQQVTLLKPTASPLRIEGDKKPLWSATQNPSNERLQGSCCCDLNYTLLTVVCFHEGGRNASVLLNWGRVISLFP